MSDGSRLLTDWLTPPEPLDAGAAAPAEGSGRSGGWRDLEPPGAEADTCWRNLGEALAGVATCRSLERVLLSSSPRRSQCTDPVRAHRLGVGRRSAADRLSGGGSPDGEEREWEYGSRERRQRPRGRRRRP